MSWLILASLIWGFSFGLIKTHGLKLDPLTLSLLRSSIAMFCFLPNLINVMRLRRIHSASFIFAGLAGMIQIGFMYAPYLLSFQYLKAHEVAMFTMTTPIIMAAILATTNRTSVLKLLLVAILATIGGIVASWKSLGTVNLWKGIILVQCSNVLFAIGSILWISRAKKTKADDLLLMLPYFAGACIGSLLLWSLFGAPLQQLTKLEWILVLWLGVVASGIGFFLWNRGITKCNPSLVAAANNLKLPLAMAISFIAFGESADHWHLWTGLSLIMAALYLGADFPQTKSSR